MIEENPTTKLWYQSRTVWLGVLTVAVAGLTSYVGGAKWEQALLVALGAAIVALRAKTTKPLGRKQR
jgi:hypothetical protein